MLLESKSLDSSASDGLLCCGLNEPLTSPRQYWPSANDRYGCEDQENSHCDVYQTPEKRTYKIDPMISHMATASKAIEKKIAAHLRRYSNPIPTTVEQKKKMEILIIAAGLKGPSIRARGLIITSSMTTSKPNVNTPAGFNGFTFPFI